MHEIHVCVIGSTDPLSSLMKYLAVTIDRGEKMETNDINHFHFDILFIG